MKRQMTKQERSALLMAGGTAIGVFTFFQLARQGADALEDAPWWLRQAIDPRKSLLGGLLLTGKPYGGFDR